MNTWYTHTIHVLCHVSTVHTHTHLYMHTHICTYTHTSVHAHTHLYMHTHYTYIVVCIICTCTHTKYVLCHVWHVHTSSVCLCKCGHIRLQCVRVYAHTYTCARVYDVNPSLHNTRARTSDSLCHVWHGTMIQSSVIHTPIQTHQHTVIHTPIQTHQTDTSNRHIKQTHQTHILSRTSDSLCLVWHVKYTAHIYRHM